MSKRKAQLREARYAYEQSKKLCREQLGVGARGRLSAEESRMFYETVQVYFKDILVSNMHFCDETAEAIARETIQHKQVPEGWFGGELESAADAAAIDAHTPSTSQGGAQANITARLNLGSAEALIPGIPDLTPRVKSSKKATVALHPVSNPPHAPGLDTLAAAAGTHASARSLPALDSSTLMRQCASLMLHLADARDELADTRRRLEPSSKNGEGNELLRLREENYRLRRELEQLQAQAGVPNSHDTDLAPTALPHERTDMEQDRTDMEEVDREQQDEVAATDSNVS